jgi:hypothetical protein
MTRVSSLALALTSIVCGAPGEEAASRQAAPGKRLKFTPVLVCA